MPIYEYECPTHGRFEVQQRITEDALKKCPTPKCGKPVKKLISNTSFTLKGGGWYATDYNGKSNIRSETKSKPVESSKSETASDTKSEAKTETKTETKVEAKAEAKPAPAASGSADS